MVRLQRRQEPVRRGTRQAGPLDHLRQRRRTTPREKSKDRYRLVQYPDPALASGTKNFYTVHMLVIMSQNVRQYKKV